MPTIRQRRKRTLDPTRTTTLRQAFARQLRKKFRKLKGKMYTWLVLQDSLSMATNAFCPTGEGGGVDPSCSPGGSSGGGGGGSSPLEGAKVSLPKRTYRKVKEVTAKVKKKLVDRYGAKTAAAIVAAAQATAWASAAAAPFVGLPGAWIPSGVAAAPYIALAELKYQLTKGKTANEELTLSDEEIQQLARELIRELEGELTVNAPPMRFAFASSAEKLKAFREWLREQFEEELLDEDVWRRYTMEGFKRGAGRAFDDARAAEKATGQKPEDFWVGSKQEFLRSAFGRRESVEKVKLLASRSFTDLRNVTDDMATRMGRTLADGLVAGKNPRDIADDLNSTLQLGRNRSEVIARTEIIRAHAEGQLDAFDRLGIEDIGVMVEWSTAGDDRVCDACAPMEGAVFRVQEAHGMIPRHPQCRCAFIPANVGEETDSQLRTKGELGGAIQESLEAAGQDSDEWGPDTTITKGRPMSLLMDFSRLIHAENVFCPTGEGGGVDPSCSPGGGGGAPEQGWTGKHGSVGIVAELKPYERNKLTREENREFVRLRNEGIKLNRDARRDPEKRTPEARQRAKEIKARLVELRDKARAAVRPEEKQAFKEEQQRRRDEEIVRRAQEERQAAEGGREEGRSGPAIRGMQPMGGGGSGAAGVTPARSGDGIKLQGSPITNTKNLGGGANESKKVTFSDGTHGVWKPSDGEAEGLRDTVPDGTFYRREAAASSIAKITGMADLVPETVERNIGGKIGSMQRWVDNSRVADDAGDRMWNGEKDLARAAAFDMMIGNTDRHSGNWMVERSTGKLALIDNGLAFPTGMEEHRSFIAYRAYSERMPVPKEVLDWDGAKIDRTLQEHKIESEARELVQKRLHVLKESAKKDRPFPLFSTQEREWDEALR